MCRFWWFVVNAVLCALCAPFNVVYASPADVTPKQEITTNVPMIVSYNKIPSLSNPYAYRYELIQQILEISRPEYGDYQLNSYEMEITSGRQAEFLGKGKVLNLAWGSPGSLIANANAIPITIDILNGLLGYRVCLINKSAPIKIDKITDVASLSHIKIGQGLWIDVDFYKFNHLEPMAVPSFDNLFSMLSAKRIDCIALGINEVEAIYQDKKKAFPAIDIDKTLLIYYYFPTYLYVSKNTPELAKRIRLGLTKMKKSGAFDDLFMRYHEKNLAHLELNHRKMICLNSPYLTSANACAGPLF
ncbi:MAG: hypothetical protein V4732_16560 [Pseudomonadota bacterium]